MGNHLVFATILSLSIWAQHLWADSTDTSLHAQPTTSQRRIDDSPRIDALAKKHIKFDPATGVCDFSDSRLNLYTFQDSHEKEFVAALDERYPGLSKSLSDPKRTQVVKVDDTIFLPPGNEGDLASYTSEEYAGIAQHILDQYYESLEIYKQKSAEAASYSASMRGWLRDRNSGDQTAEEIAREGARSLALVQLKHLKSIGVTDEKVLGKMTEDLHNADKIDAEHLKQNLNNLTKTMIATPIIALAVPVAMFAATGAAVAGGASFFMSGTGVAIPTAQGAAVAAGAGLGIGGTVDLGLQTAEKIDGTRKQYDFKRTGVSAATGAVAAPLMVAGPTLGVAAGVVGLVDQGYEAQANIQNGHYATAGANTLNALLAGWGTKKFSGKGNSSVTTETEPVIESATRTPEASEYPIRQLTPEEIARIQGTERPPTEAQILERQQFRLRMARAARTARKREADSWERQAKTRSEYEPDPKDQSFVGTPSEWAAQFPAAGTPE